MGQDRYFVLHTTIDEGLMEGIHVEWKNKMLFFDLKLIEGKTIEEALGEIQ